MQKRQIDQLVNAIKSKAAEDAMAELEEIGKHTTKIDDLEDLLEPAAC